MNFDLNKILLGKAEDWINKYRSPLFFKEFGWKAVCFVHKCGQSNPFSFAVRPLFVHKRFRTSVGAILVGLMVIGVISGPVSSVFAGQNSEVELGTWESKDVNFMTKDSVVAPLPKMDISQRFWFLHPGLDLRAPVGTLINPIMSGQVIVVEQEKWDYGKHVIIQHTNGYKSLYAHMSEIDVKMGETVRTDTVLGKVGSTGKSTGPHLHLEIWEDEKRIDPEAFLRL